MKDYNSFQKLKPAAWTKLDNEQAKEGLAYESGVEKRDFQVINDAFLIVAESSAMIIYISHDDKCIYINPAFTKFTGYELEDLGDNSLVELIHPDWRDMVRELDTDGLKSDGYSFRYEIKILAKNGEEKWIDLSLTYINMKAMSVLMVSGFDINDRKEAERKLNESEQRFRTITDNMLDLIAQIDLEGKYEYVSPSFLHNTGWTPAEMLGKRFTYFLHPEDANISWAKFWNLRELKTPESSVCRFRHSKGHYIWVETLGNPMSDDQGIPTGAIFVSRDIDERKKAEDQMRYMVEHDPLTGLYNRSFFEKAMQDMEDQRLWAVGIIVWDVDGLKLVNDSLGHKVGDDLLLAFSDILQNNLPNNSIIARIGGDEFATILPSYTIKQLGYTSEKINRAIKAYNSNSVPFLISVSMGYALKSGYNNNILHTYRQANNHMYRQKLFHGQSARSAIVELVMKALEERDFCTEGHTDRLQDLVTLMADAMNLADFEKNALRLLGRFHDIGKVGIPDYILFKPGRLTVEEFEEMKKHSEIGYRIAQSAADLIPIADWILKHHEWWNGAGYPLGLKGEEIPRECRILAIADAYDAMISDRPYRKAMPQREAIDELRKWAGIQFDPYLVDEFIQILPRGKENSIFEY